jgi:hypothetical protein
MSGISNYILNQKINAILGKSGSGGASNLDAVLTAGNSAGANDIDMNNNDILQLKNINNFLYFDSVNNRLGINVAVPTEDLELDGNFQLNTGSTSKIKFYNTPQAHENSEIDSQTEGTNGGNLQLYTKEDGGAVGKRMTINNKGAIGIGDPADFGTTGKMLMSKGSLALPTWSAFPSLSIAVGIVAPTYSNGVYYTSFAGTWNKSLFVSPTHGASNTQIMQDVNNSFTGLYNIATGIITIPTGYSGWWAINWSMALATGSPSTSYIVAQLGSGSSESAFADNSANVRSFLTSGTYVGTYNANDRFAMSGNVYLSAGQTIAVYTYSLSQVNIGGDYAPANFRVSFLGF